MVGEAPESGSDLQQLSNIFEARLKRRKSGASVLSSDERVALIGRFAGVLRRLSELMNITIAGAPAPPLDAVLGRLMQIVTDALGADRSSLFLHDRETGELFSRIAQGGLVDEIRLQADEGVAAVPSSE
jgi:adenylate cyclase